MQEASSDSISSSALADTNAEDDGVLEAVHTALADLDAVSDQPVAEHVRRFEAAHTALTDALSTADTYLSGTSANRS